jgi:hypothetical protein
MSKKKIAIFVGGGLASLLVGLILFAYYDFTHHFRFPSITAEQVAGAEIAFKGALGEAIFSGQSTKAVTDVPVEGKSGLDTLLAPPPTNNKDKGLIAAYQKDPKKFKHYADMLDTAMNAKQVGDVLLAQQALHLPQTSESLLIDPKVKTDAWGNPFCIISIGERVAIVSGGPSHLSCNSLPLNAQQIANSNRSIYAGPSDVVVVIMTHQPVASRKTTSGS